MGLTILPPSPDPPSPTTHTHLQSPSSEDESMSSDNPDIDSRPTKRQRLTNTKSSQIAIPGEIITSETQWMRGHGTFIPEESESVIYASLAGPVVKTNRLLTVPPMRARKYYSERFESCCVRSGRLGRAFQFLVKRRASFILDFPLSHTSRLPQSLPPNQYLARLTTTRLFPLDRRPPPRPHPHALKIPLASRHIRPPPRSPPPQLHQPPRRHPPPSHHHRRTPNAQLLPRRRPPRC